MDEECDCSICCQSNDLSETCYRLPCGHTFHPHCIISWFREGQSTCPNCRSEPEEENALLPDVFTRASMLRRKYKNAPPILKRLIDDLRKKEASRRDQSSRRKDYYQTNRHILKEYRSLQSQKRKAYCAVRRAKRRLGLFNSSSFPLPLISRNFFWW